MTLLKVWYKFSISKTFGIWDLNRSNSHCYLLGQTVCDPVADLAPLQVQEDPHDGGGGLAPGAGLLPAPGEAELPLPLPQLTLRSVSCSAWGATPSTPSTSSAPPSAPSRPRRRYGLLYLHYTSNNCIMYTIDQDKVGLEIRNTKYKFTSNIRVIM